MTTDTDTQRMFLAAYLNTYGVPATYEGPIWDTEQLQTEFTVEGFAAPFVVVRRKGDGQRGTLSFTHSPRIYFDFVEV